MKRSKLLVMILAVALLIGMISAVSLSASAEEVQDEPTEGTTETTKYGTIPAEYSDINEYPIIIFKNGEAIHGFKDWQVFFAKTIKNDTNLREGCVMYLRTDYTASMFEATTSPNISYLSDITIDLNEKTLNRGKGSTSCHLFQAASANGTPEKSTITLTNGTLSTTGSFPPIIFNGSKATSFVKEYDFILDGITVDISTEFGIVASYGNSTTDMKATVTFNDCTINRGSNTNANSKLFDLNDTSSGATTKQLNDISIVINGGTLTTDSFTNLTICDYDVEGDSIKFGKGSDGKEFTIVSSAKAPDTAFDICGLGHYLLEGEGGYTFVNAGTPFGTLPRDYMDAESYPFAVFYNGAFKMAYASWKTASEAAIGYIDTKAEAEACDTVYIALRRDYEHKDVQSASIMAAKGKIVLDLQGFKLSTPNVLKASDPTKNESTALFNAYAQYNQWTTKEAAAKYLEYTTEFVAQNGTLENGRKGAGMFVLDTTGTLSVAGYNRKNFVFGFNNVSFRTASQPVMHGWNNKSGTGFDVTVNFEDCNFDFTSSTSATVTMFSFADNSQLFNADVNVNSDNCIVTGMGTKHKLIAVGSDDSISGMPTPTTYLDKEAYPVLLYKATGEFVGAYADFGSAHSAISKTSTETFLAYVRRDISQSTKKLVDISFTGKIILDLGGHTLTQTSSYFLDISATGNANADYKIAFEISNGTLVRNGGYGLININYSTSNVLSALASYDFKFTDVTFRCLSGKSDSPGVLFHTWENGWGDEKVTSHVKVDSEFNNCTFDLAGSKDGFYMLHLGHNSGERDRIVHNVTINGGTVLADSAAQFNDYFVKLDTLTEGRYDTITYGEGFNIVLPLGSTAPAGEYNGLVFKLDSATDTTVTYKLAPKAPIVYNPKSSVTLYADFVYNVYLPQNALVSALLNGNAVNLDELQKVTLSDGVAYYKLPVSLASYEALNNIVVKVTVTDGTKNYAGTFTFNVYNYAVSIVSGSYSDTEKNLVYDMVSYAKAAYTYFGKESDKLDDVDALLGEDYNNTADMSNANDAETPADTGFTNVTLHLGNSPAYRFYYDGTAPSYTFTVGSREVTAVPSTDSKGGTYLEVKVYAYELPLGVTFGEHSYSVYSYYKWLTDTANGDNATEAAQASAAMPLVERLVNYCEAADAFKKSVESAN